MRTLLVVCAGAVVLAGGATAARRGTGLYGKALISPAYPVCRQDVPCSKPAKGFLLSFFRSGRHVTDVRTGTDGTFQVRLAAGTYAVETASPKRWYPRLHPRTARVPSAGYARITFSIDVGIR
jgi:hypothetical protein